MKNFSLGFVAAIAAMIACNLFGAGRLPPICQKAAFELGLVDAETLQEQRRKEELGRYKQSQQQKLGVAESRLVRLPRVAVTIPLQSKLTDNWGRLELRPGEVVVVRIPDAEGRPCKVVIQVDSDCKGCWAGPEERNMVPFAFVQSESYLTTKGELEIKGKGMIGLQAVLE